MTTTNPVPTPMSPDDADAMRAALAFVGKAWWLGLILGLASLAIGLIAVIWPSKTILVVAVLFGAWLLVSGIFQVVASFSDDLDTSGRVLTAITGALSILLGVLCFRSALHAAEILALIIGLSWLLRGTFQVISGIAAKGSTGRGWWIFSGVVLVLGGIVVLVWPAITLPALAWVAGIWLIVLGLFEILASLAVRSAAKRASAALG